MDKNKFNKKIKRATFELKNDARNYQKSTEDLQKEVQQLKVYTDRANKDLQEEIERYEWLKEKLAVQEDDTGDSNNRLRLQIEKMKDEMHRVSLYSINIANDPSNAI